MDVLARLLMRPIPQRIKVETVVLAWEDGLFKGAVGVSAAWLTFAVFAIILYLLIRKARP